jgi:hypothetical protein
MDSSMRKTFNYIAVFLIIIAINSCNNEDKSVAPVSKIITFNLSKYNWDFASKVFVILYNTDGTVNNVKKITEPGILDFGETSSDKISFTLIFCQGSVYYLSSYFEVPLLNIVIQEDEAETTGTAQFNLTIPDNLNSGYLSLPNNYIPIFNIQGNTISQNVELQRNNFVNNNEFFVYSQMRNADNSIGYYCWYPDLKFVNGQTNKYDLECNKKMTNKDITTSIPISSFELNGIYKRFVVPLSDKYNSNPSTKFTYLYPDDLTFEEYILSGGYAINSKSSFHFMKHYDMLPQSIDIKSFTLAADYMISSNLIKNINTNGNEPTFIESYYSGVNSTSKFYWSIITPGFKETITIPVIPPDVLNELTGFNLNDIDYVLLTAYRYDKITYTDLMKYYFSNNEIHDISNTYVDRILYSK